MKSFNSHSQLHYFSSDFLSWNYANVSKIEGENTKLTWNDMTSHDMTWHEWQWQVGKARWWMVFIPLRRCKIWMGIFFGRVTVSSLKGIHSVHFHSIPQFPQEYVYVTFVNVMEWDGMWCKCTQSFFSSLSRLNSFSGKCIHSLARNKGFFPSEIKCSLEEAEAKA